MARLLRLSWILLLTAALVACAGNAPPPTSPFPSPVPPTAPATFLPSPTDTAAPLPTSVAPPTEAVAATLPAPCFNYSNFLADMTVPDGAQFLPGQGLVKKWAVQNTGSCDWGPDYRLVLTSGDGLGAASELALYPARGGTPATLEIPMLAPLNPGEYTGRWQARDPQGNLFGAVVFIKIEVIPLPTP